VNVQKSTFDTLVPTPSSNEKKPIKYDRVTLHITHHDLCLRNKPIINDLLQLLFKLLQPLT